MEENKEKQDCVLIIKLTDEGKVLISGPLDNEPLCFWLLEKTKDIIKGHNLKKALDNRPKITPAHRIINFIRGKN